MTNNVQTSNVEKTSNNPDGHMVGVSASDPVGFHGTTPTAQTTLTALATGATIATVVTSVQQIIAALQAKGLNA